MGGGPDFFIFFYLWRSVIKAKGRVRSSVERGGVECGADLAILCQSVSQSFEPLSGSRTKAIT